MPYSHKVLISISVFLIAVSATFCTMAKADIYTDAANLIAPDYLKNGAHFTYSDGQLYADFTTCLTFTLARLPSVMEENYRYNLAEILVIWAKVNRQMTMTEKRACKGYQYWVVTHNSRNNDTPNTSPVYLFDVDGNKKITSERAVEGALCLGEKLGSTITTQQYQTYEGAPSNMHKTKCEKYKPIQGSVN